MLCCLDLSSFFLKIMCFIEAGLLSSLRELTLCHNDLSNLSIHGSSKVKCDYCAASRQLSVSPVFPQQLFTCATLGKLQFLQVLDLSFTKIADWSRVLLLSQLPRCVCVCVCVFLDICDFFFFFFSLEKLLLNDNSISEIWLRNFLKFVFTYV